MNLILCLFFCFLRFNLVILDCGCNKANRDSIDDNKISDNKDVENDYCLGGNSEDCRKNDSTEDMVIIPRGTYLIGTNQPVFVADKESPERIVHLESDFYMDKYEISNKKFAEFIEATNYITEAERYNDSFIFEALLSKELRDQYQDSRVVNALWWYKVDGVNWKHPAPEMDLKDIVDHPVVHVSWHDAVAYCSWKNKRLPTEAEWEIACRGGRKGKLFPWGDKLMPKNEHWMNIWQGKFPNENKADDGYTSTCPVDKFKQNPYGLYNIVGNVWEWTADLWDKDNKVEKNPNRVKKGGSYLCHESYCYRYRCAARSQNTEDSSAGNLGFRCVKDIV